MSNYDRRDRQDETAMWDAGEVRRQESAQQQRRGDEKRRSARRRTGTAIYLVCVVLGSCLLAGIGWLMINDLCSLNKAPVEVEITVDEAGYDGKTLYLQWRFRMMDVDRTLGDPDESGLYSDDLQLLDDHNVGWWIDHIWINGKAIDMPANSAGDERGSSVPGEIIESWSYRLDNEDLYLPDGKIEISLPIGERQPLDDYSLLNHPEVYDEDGTLKLPEKGMVTFQLKTDMRSKVKVEKPEQWTEMPDLRACVSEADYTPIMMYVTLKLEGNPDSLAKFIEENGEGYLDENGELLWPYSGMDVYGEWASGLTLVDGDGKEVFPGMQEEYGFVYGNNGYGDNWAEYLFPYRESYPAEMWLAPMENGTADMTKAVRVR